MRKLALALAVLCASSARGQAPPDAPPNAPNPAEGRAGDFAVLLLVSPEPEKFLEQWNQPARPGYVPSATTTSKLKRGDKVAAFVVFSGCRADEAGNCQATADFHVLKPDGSEYGAPDTGELWRGKPAPSKGRLQLGVAQLMIRIEPTDPLGKYTLNVVAHDNVANVSVPVTAGFEVMEAASSSTRPRILPTAVRTRDDLDVVFTEYYRGPDPDIIEGTIVTLGKEGLLDRASSVAPVLGFFTYVFAANPARVPDWKRVIDEQGDATKKALLQALELSHDPTRLFAGKSPSPELNDARWGAFFATGDTAHVAALIAVLEHMDERKDRTLFLAAASAKWSLASNARRHDLVKTSLSAARVEEPASMQREIDDILSHDPDEIRAATVEVIRAQHAAGVW